MRTLTAALLASVLLAGCSVGETTQSGANLTARQRMPLDDPAWTTRFDPLFRKYAKRIFGVGFDWRWFKAQGIAESGLRPRVASGAGARGVMQLLPATYEEIAGPNRAWLSDIEEPRWNIAAGILYDRYLYDLWDDVGSDRLNRFAFTFASYNAGRTRTLRAQDRCSGVDCGVWSQVAPFVPSESRNYVSRIFQLLSVELPDR